MNHFDQPVRRQAQFIKPSMELKQKVGYGGLAPEILRQAQDVIEQSSGNFLAIATQHLTALNEAVRLAGTEMGNHDSEILINTLLTPAVQLKGHGSMFGYPSISLIASRLVQFLEVIEEMNADVLDIASSYYTAMNAIIVSRVKEEEHPQTTSLYEALNSACNRFFEKYSG